VPSQGLPPSAAPAAVDLPLEPELLEFINAHRGDPNSHAITLLVEKFGQMQQQMLEQFHQTMMMMIQHMGETHRDQLRQVREEVDRLRLLSEELVSVKAQLEHTPAAPTTGPQPEPTTADAAGPPPQEAPRTFEIPEPRPGAEDPLVMVTRRIAQIRSEQRSRWQRILDLVRTPR
jgi:hypothetical protein